MGPSCESVQAALTSTITFDESPHIMARKGGESPLLGRPATSAWPRHKFKCTVKIWARSQRRGPHTHWAVSAGWLKTSRDATGITKCSAVHDLRLYKQLSRHKNAFECKGKGWFAEWMAIHVKGKPPNDHVSSLRQCLTCESNRETGRRKKKIFSEIKYGKYIKKCAANSDYTSATTGSVSLCYY